MRLLRQTQQVLADGVKLTTAVAVEHLLQLCAHVFIRIPGHLGFRIHALRIQDPALVVRQTQALGSPCQVEGGCLKRCARSLLGDIMANRTRETALIAHQLTARRNLLPCGRAKGRRVVAEPVGVRKALGEVFCHGWKRGHPPDRIAGICFLCPRHDSFSPDAVALNFQQHNYIHYDCHACFCVR